MTHSDSGVRLLRNHGLAELVLDQPTKRNALSYEMWSAIPRLVAQVETDKAVSVLIVRGAGDHFSAGADISEFEARAPTPTTWCTTAKSSSRPRSPCSRCTSHQSR